MRAPCRDADLPCTGTHHPDLAREHTRIVARSCCGVRDRCELCARTAERQRDDLNPVDVARRCEDLDAGDTGNRVRRPDGDEQVVGTSVTVEEDVWAADMRVDPRLNGGEH